ncbi:negative elongation factor A [Toxorhynchites rutilus septentrionalis]|uniref:negative elongation factor A n=1 Tax=Toxorhynchites rutilus septentrionalis TaxID=329112 RepID=UPI00247A6776|nr:negative elongation factor A [Toxorhynchites rutilus septentrionalis]
MANVRDSDISLWLHNKLGTSNDSWISGSIISQLNKEVLRNIKECFPDLQTQVKLKLLLSFFHIPRRIVEEWKTELEEVIEVAGLDSELWVSMIAETIKTLPTTGSLNTEISDYEETRPIFTDMVNELRRLVVKNADLGLLPLECQYLNKSALVTVVGQQSTPVKHFTLKRKPKSANLRAELLQKSSDAQSCLKKISAPTVPLRSRGIPRKMTDTTPLKGIPSRVPTGGFRSPASSQGQNRPSLSRTPAGRKEGGVKLLEIGEQPLGYAAAKKRKREQEREEQQKKAAEQASAQTTQDIKPVITTPTTSTVTTTTPDYAAGLTASTVYSQPATPMPVTTVKETVVSTVTSQPMQIQQTQPMEVIMDMKHDVKQEIKQEPLLSTPVQSIPVVSSTVQQTIVPPVPPLAYPTTQKITIKSEPSASVAMTASNPPSLVRSVALPTVTQVKTQPQLQHQSFPAAPSSVQMIQQSAASGIVSKGPPKIEIFSSKTIQPATIQTSIPKSTTIINQGGNILFTTKPAQPNTTAASSGTTIIQQKPALQSYVLNTSPPGKQINIQRIITNANVAPTPTLTTMISRAHHQQQQQQLIQAQQQIQPQQTVQTPTTPTRIVQIKTAPTVSLNNSSLLQNIPPLISTQHPASNTQPTILNIQTIQQQQQQQQPIQIQQSPTTPQKRTITITAQNPQSNNMIATSVAQILQQQQLQQQQQSIQTTSIVTGSTQQPKYAQVVMSPNVKGKTIFLTNPSSMPSVLNQKGVILRTVDPSGNTVYQQIPLQNVSGLSGATILTSPPGLVKTEQDPKSQLSQIPALVPTSSLHQNIPALTPVVIQPAQQQQQQQQTQQTSTIPALITSISPQGQQQQAQQIKTSPQTMTIIRPVGSNNVQTMLPQGLTLIQRPGQQPQLVQTIQANQAQTVVGQQQTQTRTIITQIPQQQIQQQQQQQQQQQHTIQFQAAGSPRAGGTTIQLVQQPQQDRNVVQQQPQQIQIQRTQMTQQQQQGSTVTIQQQNATAVGQQQIQQQGARKGLSLSNKHVMEAHDMFKRANRVTRLEKALILSFMAGSRNNPRPNPENVVTIKLNESKEKVLQTDDTQAVMLVESLITLDYNTGEWKTFRKYRELDPSQQNETSPGTTGGVQSGGLTTTQQNSVVI